MSKMNEFEKKPCVKMVLECVVDLNGSPLAVQAVVTRYPDNTRVPLKDIHDMQMMVKSMVAVLDIAELAEKEGAVSTEVVDSRTGEVVEVIKGEKKESSETGFAKLDPKMYN